jgi:hypothetical protein
MSQGRNTDEPLNSLKEGASMNAMVKCANPDCSCVPADGKLAAISVHAQRRWPFPAPSLGQYWNQGY